MEKNDKNISTEEFEAIQKALSIALSEEVEVHNVALTFAQKVVTLSKTPKILRLADEMRQSAKFREKTAKKDPDIITEVGTACKKIISQKCPTAKVLIEGRVKTLFSELNKRLTKMLENQSSQIQDLLALRIIIVNESDPKTETDLCYAIANAILSNFSQYDLSVKTDLSWDLSIKQAGEIQSFAHIVKERYPHVYIPCKSSILPIFESNVKNYIFKPNKKGYQSLHFIISYKGIPLEIQIRSMTMHNWAVSGPAKHTEYKESKKFQGIKLDCFDISKIKTPHYNVDQTGKIISFPGLTDSVIAYSDKNF